MARLKQLYFDGKAGLQDTAHFIPGRDPTAFEQEQVPSQHFWLSHGNLNMQNHFYHTYHLFLYCLYL